MMIDIMALLTFNNRRRRLPVQEEPRSGVRAVLYAGLGSRSNEVDVALTRKRAGTAVDDRPVLHSAHQRI
jgi:hypothetical protein